MYIRMLPLHAWEVRKQTGTRGCQQAARASVLCCFGTSQECLKPQPEAAHPAGRNPSAAFLLTWESCRFQGLGLSIMGKVQHGGTAGKSVLCFQLLQHCGHCDAHLLSACETSGSLR